MTYFNQFHKEKTERCLKKMKTWYTSPISLQEQQQIAERMKQNLALALTMEGQA